MECSIEGCVNSAKYKATGWCQMHYHRYWRTGSLELEARMPRSDIGYGAAHARTRKQFGPAHKNPCVYCGKPADEYAYDGADPSEVSAFIDGKWPVVYSVWPEFYMPLCFPCHRAKDRGAWAERRSECSKGHELTLENIYERPSRPGSRECKTCRVEGSARRYRARKSSEH